MNRSSYADWRRDKNEARRRQSLTRWLLASDDPTDRLEGLREQGCYYCRDAMNDRLVRVDPRGLFAAENTVPCCAACERERLHLDHDELARKYYGVRSNKPGYLSQKGTVHAY